MEHQPFVPGPAWVVPFACLLAGLAALPLVAAEWWESNGRKLAFSAVLAAPVLALYLLRSPADLAHAAEEYLSFVVLIGGLFFVAGGVLLEGDLEASPLTNVTFLGLGALLASAIGTTGVPHRGADSGVGQRGGGGAARHAGGDQPRSRDDGRQLVSGQGPNFMVRSIAEQRGVRMPSFGGYMVYSAAIAIPLFIAMTFLFFRVNG